MRRLSGIRLATAAVELAGAALFGISHWQQGRVTALGGIGLCAFFLGETICFFRMRCPFCRRHLGTGFHGRYCPYCGSDLEEYE